jgi:hypothetical protein
LTGESGDSPLRTDAAHGSLIVVIMTPSFRSHWHLYAFITSPGVQKIRQDSCRIFLMAGVRVGH